MERRIIMFEHDEDEEFSWEDIIDDEEEGESKEIVEAAPQTVAVIDSIELPLAWGQPTTSIDAVRRQRQSINTKHGLFANVPIVCKGGDCPFFQICTIDINDQPIGHRCPIEIAAIIELYDRYCRELDIGEEDYFDKSQIKDLVDCEIKLLRCNGHLAISADFIEEIVTAVDNKGKAHTKPELHKATEYEQQLLQRKRQLLADLNATRAKRNQGNNVADPSSFASELMRRAMKMGRGAKVIDADIIEDDNSANIASVPEGE
jgi:hypothetical protein